MLRNRIHGHRPGLPPHLVGRATRVRARRARKAPSWVILRPRIWTWKQWVTAVGMAGAAVAFLVVNWPTKQPAAPPERSSSPIVVIIQSENAVSYNSTNVSPKEALGEVPTIRVPSKPRHAQRRPIPEPQCSRGAP
jgi:hypothetical protein